MTWLEEVLDGIAHEDVCEREVPRSRLAHDAEHGEKRVQLPVLVILCHGGQSIAITLVSPTHYWGGGALSCCFSAQRRTRPSYAPR